MTTTHTSIRKAPSTTWLRVLRAIGNAIMWTALALMTLWALAALYIDFRIEALRIPITVLYAAAVITVFFKFKGRRWLPVLYLVGFCCVLAWWFTLKPTNDANWEPDGAKSAWAEFHGDRVTIHNFRNCDYRSEHDYSNCWGDRTVDLSQIRGVDLFLDNWGIEFASHPMVSFQFGDKEHVVFSIEARYKVGQTYSTILGCFRQFGLMVVAADERDVIRLRTNYRKDENVYLYRVNVRPEIARKMFLTYVTSMNDVKDHPQWYNEVTRNCTTTLQKPLASNLDDPQPWNYQYLLNGTLDRLLYERGRFVTGGLSFPELKQQALINPAAHAAGLSPDFSAMVRAGRVGF